MMMPSTLSMADAQSIPERTGTGSACGDVWRNALCRIELWPMLRMSAVVLLIACLAALLTPRRAAAEFTSIAEFAILMDYETRAVLYEKNADELMAPASMSKLMTLAVVFKALKEGKYNPSDTFPISEHAWRKGGAPSGTSAMFAPLNKQVALSDLLQGIIIQSGNDACIAVAEGFAGSEEKFAVQMVALAREIGLKKSTFGNPTGLPHPDQLMTARELAQLSHYLIKTYPEYYRYFSQKSFPYQPEGRNKPYAFFNRNPLLGLDIGADGLKTGHTRESGYGLVGSALRKGRRLIVVVNGLKSAADRRKEAERLLELGFNSFTEFKIFDSGEIIGQATVWGGRNWRVSLVGEGDVRVLMPKFSAKPRIRAQIVYDGPLKAPIRRGDRVAILKVKSDDTGTNEIPLFAADDVEAGSFISKGLGSIYNLATRWIP